MDTASTQQVFEESFQYDAMGNVTQLYRAQDGYTLNDMDITFSGNRITSVCDYADESPLTNNFLHTPWSNDGNAYLYDANGNETRNMSHNVSHVKYNLLNLPDSVIFADGNVLSFVYMADGRRVGTDSHTGSTPLVLPGTGGHGGPQVQTWEHYDGDVTASPTGFTRLAIPGGYLTFGREFCEFTPSQGGGLSFEGEWTRSLSSHYYVTDYLGSVVAVCSGETGTVEQSLEYMPSGAVFSATNYGSQPYKFCGKELITMHGWDMYDSFARYQYARLPRFSTMDPLAEWDYATSPYAYCQNDFVNLADPWGLFPTWEEAYKASLDHPGSFVGQDWITGNYFYSYRLDSDDLVLAHREFGIMGNPDSFGRPYISSITSFNEAPYSYNGGGIGAFSSSETRSSIVRTLNNANTMTSAIVSPLCEPENKILKIAELSYLITEKIDNNPILSKGIEWHASNLKYIKIASKVSDGLSLLILLYDAGKGYADDGYVFGYHTSRNIITGIGGIIGGHYGGIYGAKWGAIGHLPGVVAGGIVGTISGNIAGEYVSGMLFDNLYNFFK